MGVLDYRLAIVISLPPVGLVGKELLEEEGFGGFFIAKGTLLSLSIHSLVGLATVEAAMEGAWVLALVLGVRVGIHREVVVRGSRLIALED